MAVDEMLLERAADEAAPCLRLYGWSEPTLSLGYFQGYADRERHPPSLSCPAVRRLTGGGAIVHDAELTYSIVLPAAHPLAVRRDELYRAVHISLIEALADFGIAARLCEAADKTATAREPFLCFQRKFPGDVLVGGVKICGSAQRRRNEAVLQHGSLLWRRSPAAPQLAGLTDVVKRPIELENLVQRWLGGLARRLGLGWGVDDLDKNEVRRAESLAESHYSDDNWTRNRGRAAAHGQEKPLTTPMAPDRVE